MAHSADRAFEFAMLPAEKLFAPRNAVESLLRVIDEVRPTDTGKVFDFRGDEIPL